LKPVSILLEEFEKLQLILVRLAEGSAGPRATEKPQLQEFQ
jgi:hypothetical protein